MWYFVYLCKLETIPFPQKESDSELTMRQAFIIIMVLLPLVSFAQENGNSDLQLMESVKGQMKNSYMDVKWIDAAHFTYSADESEGKMYYITVKVGNLAQARAVVDDVRAKNLDLEVDHSIKVSYY